MAKFTETAIVGYLKRTATFVSEEHYEARVEVCKGCELYGDVVIPPGVTTKGCTECGCPSTTKPRVVDYLNLKTLRREVAECPLGKWSTVDKSFIS